MNLIVTGRTVVLIVRLLWSLGFYYIGLYYIINLSTFKNYPKLCLCACISICAYRHTHIVQNCVKKLCPEKEKGEKMH